MEGAGKPPPINTRGELTMAAWKYRIDIGHIWNDETLSFEEKRDQIVVALKDSRPYRMAKRYCENDSGDDYWDHEQWMDDVERLAESADEEEFDANWDSIYDYADVYRIWIDIFGTVK